MRGLACSPIDACNRPRHSGDFHVRVPPSPQALAAFFAAWRGELPAARKWLAAARHYAMARNLVFEVRRHYDEALSRFDVLVMPTLPMVATLIPAASDPREVYIARALEMIPNTAPFDISGHPAISVPAGLADGLPVGMMIVGKRFDDAACLRVAHAFERLSGGFPAPPGAA